MRVGIFQSPSCRVGADPADSFRRFLDVAVEAERLGFWSCWASEHHFGSDRAYRPFDLDEDEYQATDYDMSVDPFMMLMALAGKTSRLRLGTAVAITHWDHPVRTAEKAAMLDVLSGGRLEFGVGRGSGWREEIVFDVPVDADANARKYQEAVEIIRGLWSGEDFSFDGEFYTLPKVNLVPQPTQQPAPLWIGSASLSSGAWAASLRLPYATITWPVTELEMYRRKLASFREAADAEGWDVTDAPIPHVLFMHCAETDEEAQEVAHRHLLQYQYILEHHYEYQRRAESSEFLTRQAEKFRQTDYLAQFVLDNHIVGSPDTCVERLQMLSEELDLNYLLANVAWGMMPHEQTLESLRLFAEHVMPEFVGPDDVPSGPGGPAGLVRPAGAAPTAGELGIRSLLEPTGDAVLADLERVRAAGDVIWDERLEGWLVTSHHLVREVARADDSLWMTPFGPERDIGAAGMTPLEFADFMAWNSDRHITFLTGESHKRSHRWWVRALAPHILDAWRTELIRPIAAEVAESLAPRGSAELVREFADVVPPRVMAAVMGLPTDAEFIGRLVDLTNERLSFQQYQSDDTPRPEVVERALAASREMQDMLLPYIEERRGGEGNDFVSLVWADAENLLGPGYTDQDVVATAMAAWEGGSVTTPYSTANGLYMLMTQPELQDRLREGGPSAVSAFVEESLRIYGPVIFRPRYARRDTELGGVRIAKGQMVVAVTLAAGHDPERFGCPHAVDLERSGRRDHFSFYKGPRSCPGQALARVELEEMVAVVLDTLPGLRLDPDQEPPVYQELVMRRWKPLHAVWSVVDGGSDVPVPDSVQATRA
jgi:alkanesulfonate monooxygenase SsuD/methylene tetrahydromethanopterin reductase-like flavin-dependent oxidoreductase (luciferase family)/cytochrome P450